MIVRFQKPTGESYIVLKMLYCKVTHQPSRWVTFYATHVSAVCLLGIFAFVFFFFVLFWFVLFCCFVFFLFFFVNKKSVWGKLFANHRENVYKAKRTLRSSTNVKICCDIQRDSLFNKCVLICYSYTYLTSAEPIGHSRQVFDIKLIAWSQSFFFSRK